MCKKSDIILVDHYISQNQYIGKHPFVVIDDEVAKFKVFLLI